MQIDSSEEESGTGIAVQITLMLEDLNGMEEQEKLMEEKAAQAEHT